FTWSDGPLLAKSERSGPVTRTRSITGPAGATETTRARRAVRRCREASRWKRGVSDALSDTCTSGRRVSAHARGDVGAVLRTLQRDVPHGFVRALGGLGERAAEADHAQHPAAGRDQPAVGGGGGRVGQV